MIRNLERQPGQDHGAQRLARHIHPLPEGEGAEEHGAARGAEPLEQIGRRAVGDVPQEGPGAHRRIAQEIAVDPIEEGPRSEQQERTAVGGFDHPAAFGAHRLPPAARIGSRIGHRLRHVQERLAPVVEGGAERDGARGGEAEAIARVRE